MISFLSNYFVSILAIAALTVLTALGKVDSNTAVPLIVGLAGVHAGATLSGDAPAPAPATLERSEKFTPQPVTSPTPVVTPPVQPPPTAT